MEIITGILENTISISIGIILLLLGFKPEWITKYNAERLKKISPFFIVCGVIVIIINIVLIIWQGFGN